MWNYLIEGKSDVFTQFKKFKLLVEKQVDCSIKKLRTDGRVNTFPLNMHNYVRNKEFSLKL